MAVRMSGLVSNLDTESIIKDLMSAQSMKKKKLENKITKLEWKQEKWKEMNTKIYSFYSDALSKFRLQSSFGTKKVASSDENKVSVTAANSAPEGTHTLKVNQLASSQFVTGAQLSTDINSKAISATTKLTDLGMTAGSGNVISVTAGTTTKNLEISDTTTVADFTQMLKDAGLNASYDTTQKRFFISSRDSGYKNAFSISTTGSVDMTKLGLSTITATKNVDNSVSVSGGSNITLVAPSDAEFVYNGATLTSSTNNVTVNGLTFTLKNTTDDRGTETQDDDEVLSITVSNDTQAVYDNIKSFVKSYNELLKEMNELFYADSAAGYEPLSDDDKEAMSDDEIEKWEDKIKDSLLRRDDNLSSLMDTFRTSLSGSIEVNNKSYSLASFGIATSSDYSEKGILHIDGNKDDSTTSAKDDKLMAALTSDPDAVTQVITSLATSFYNKMTKSMSSSTLRSALTVYNDKEMKSTITDYKGDLDDMEDRLKEIEDRYYKQFSAMETALSKLNSQSSSLSSMLGTGN